MNDFDAAVGLACVDNVDRRHSSSPNAISDAMSGASVVHRSSGVEPVRWIEIRADDLRAGGVWIRSLEH